MNQPAKKPQLEIAVDAAVQTLRAMDYKVDVQKIFGHYTSKGETYQQHGFAIRVFPYQDK